MGNRQAEESHPKRTQGELQLVGVQPFRGNCSTLIMSGGTYNFLVFWLSGKVHSVLPTYSGRGCEYLVARAALTMISCSIGDFVYIACSICNLAAICLVSGGCWFLFCRSRQPLFTVVRRIGWIFRSFTLILAAHVCLSDR